MALKRTSTDKRLRGRKLQEVRKRWFERDPLCAHCQAKGRVTIATELDHIVPLFKDGADADSNRQGLCSPCHEAKTLIDMSYRQKQRFGPDGYPEGG